ncbi:hypothetical protein T08_5454 [Trichinella sp. T8]|nr:hypothetical protein T08_5454 [Trichinella sp. T8]
MADNLHLVSNERDNCNLIHEGRVYNLKRTYMEDKQIPGSIHTFLDVDAILDCNPHADDCIPDNDIVYKMEKKNALKRRAAEELKTILQIYHEEASSASADLETNTGTKISKTSANSPVAGDSTTLRMTTSGRRFLLHNNVLLRRQISKKRVEAVDMRGNKDQSECLEFEVKKVCRCSIHTNLDVDAILDCNPHADDCIPDNDIVYKMEKKNALKRRAAEELKTILQIYHEEASSASADLETVGQFPTYKSV